MPISLPDTAGWFSELNDRVEKVQPIRERGRVSQVIGLLIESIGPSVSVGDRCIIQSDRNKEITAEVVGFRGNNVLLMPLGDMEGISTGAIVTATHEPFTVGVGAGILGRVLNGLGDPIDGKGPLDIATRRPIYNRPPHPLKRNAIREVLVTGIRAVDSMVTCGKGQRLGIFAGSGVGKSVIMGMTARHTSADVNIIALIGERGREVREFIERDLGEEGLSRSVVIAVTSDQPALVRIKGGFAATTLAEYFRDQGQDVMLMMDSVTRLAMAQREIGLAVGEPPTSRGYTPSLFAMLPRLLERAGNSDKGSITGLYTVLVEGDDLNEPVADTMRSILDGHILLSRKLAEKGHYPAIDTLASISRVMSDVVSSEHLAAAREVNRVIAAYRQAEDLINVGAYEEGSNPEIDRSVALIEIINKYLQQDLASGSDFAEAIDILVKIAGAEFESPSNKDKKNDESPSE